SAGHTLTGSGPKPGTGTSPSPCRKPSRQVRYCGAQPSSALAFAFDVPRIRVIIDTPTSPAASRPSHTGTRSGGLAPTPSASSGSHTDTGRGSCRAALYSHRPPGSPGAALRPTRRASRVVHMHERPHARPVAHDREPTLADLRHDVAVSRETRPRPVEAAVPQRDPLDAPGVQHRVLEVADRRQGLLLVRGRGGVE